MTIAAVNQEPLTATDLAQSVRQAQQEFESARLAKATAQTNVDTVKREILHLAGVIDRQFMEKPSVASILPDDPAVLAWQHQHDQLENRKGKLVALREQRHRELANAESAEKEANVKLAQYRLAATHEELETLEPQLVRMNGEHQQWDLNRQAIQARIDSVTQKLEKLRPAAVDRMADFDPRRKRWERESAPLIAQQQKLIGERDDLHGVDMLEIAKVSSRINHLKNYVIPGLERVIAGHREWKGGVFRVA